MYDTIYPVNKCVAFYYKLIAYVHGNIRRRAHVQTSNILSCRCNN